MTEKIRVLYVDDEPTLLEIGKIYLERDGTFYVDTLTSAGEALTRLNTERYDAIVSDYQMPEMDGITFLKRLKGSGNTTPFIIFTGRGREEVVIEALNSGADFYLQKGGEPKSQFAELSNKIRYAVTRTHAEDALAESEVKYKTLFESAGDAIFLMDRHVFLDCNKRTEEIFGCTRDQIIGHSPAEFSKERQPDGQLSADKVKENIELAFLGGNTFFDWVHIRYDKTPFNAEVSLNRVMVRDTYYLQAIVRDITGRKVAEEILRESEEKFWTLAQYSPIAIMIFQGDRWVYSNPAGESMSGYSCKELYAMNYWDFVAPEFRQSIKERGEQRLEGKELSRTCEFRIIAKDGTSKWATLTGSRIMYKGSPAGLITVNDITDRKLAEEQLLCAKEEWERTFNAVPDLISIIDTEHTIRRVNRAMAAKLGVTPEQAVGLACYQCVHGMQSPPDFCPHSRLLKDQQEHTMEVYEERLGGYFLVTCTPLRDIDGKLIGSVHVARDITEHKKAEVALTHSHDLMRYIIEHSNSSIAVHDRDLKYIYVSQHYLDECKVKEHDIIGKHHYEVFPDLPQKWKDVHQKALAGEVSSADDDPYVQEDGTVNWTRWECRPWYEANGSIGGIIIYTEWITKRKQAEEALRTSELQFHTMFKRHDSVMLLIDPKTGKIIDANHAAERFYGSTKKELCQQSIDGINALSQEEISAEMSKAVQEQNNVFIFPHRLASGEIRTVEVHSSPIDLEGKTVLFSIIHDITKRKRAEEALRESEMNLAQAQRIAQMGSYSWDMQKDNKISMSEQMYEIFDLPRDIEISSENFLERVHPDDRAFTQQILENIINNKIRYQQFNFRVVRKNGEIRFIEVNSEISFDKNDKPVASFGTVQDTTDRKNSEKILRESEMKYRSLIESSSDAIFCVDKNGEYKFTNLVFASTFNKTPDYFIGKTFWDIYPKEHADYRQLTNLAVFETGVTQTIDVEVPLPDKTLYFIAKANPIKDETGKVILNLTHAADITKRKLAEKALEQANRKLTLLTGITRHDINNQLTILQSYLDILKSKQSDATHNEYFLKIATAAQRISAMIQFTTEYEQIGINAPIWQSFHTLVETASKQATLGQIMLKNDLPANIEVLADPLIVKVCYNLVDNAVRYGGKITIIRFSLKERNEDQIFVCEDDGDGVLAGDKEKIFTRGFGKNTGLGLALSREILAITGITIRETGEPGKGARFEMTVPKGAWRITGTDDR